ncbi:serine threonine protein kinase : Serine/threonine protein kinase OS=uncultured bacterium PE=4 SV=1: Pkinase: TPR_11: TPR_11: TPR_11: TPR_11: TPR_2: TPR_11: TPR_2 [Gemmata massiliana]|uniref:Protein kinase domain-containing protein n=1 Tax=Gemmata massiliana TaxID=1210884 RepID=A0A6P2CYZ1_9BACT|nr:tetratricopeptide repeat protein [Gemmata massiliana]VTR93345.1 serine threonine protein kinase : Serine/threonine protein kinase OS=uncultured bacterium PE=4 SV=1: Pkinase: TPR_11: TPR_11: TPR_11: TPR_11: TPR_2: TPR_11: TPR_2 [Gemmata massiliana]
MSTNPDMPEQNTVDKLIIIDRLCDRFEDEWRSGVCPSIEQFLQSAGFDVATAPANLFRELARVKSAYDAPQPLTCEPIPHSDLASGLVTQPEPPGAPAADRSGYFSRPLIPVVPGYELLDEVGRGGMGIVYRARDVHLHRDVAVKLLQEKYHATSLAAHRFLDEARITGQLQHPGIPPVHEIGSLLDGRHFLVMKLIKGRTLAAALTDVSVSRGSLIAAFELVCHAVAYAHDRGVIHRDLKPANVMIGDFGEVQVMDWGLAKFLRKIGVESEEGKAPETFHDPRAGFEEDLRTQTGSFLGTPAYMPPEQASGALDQVDERSDVFGLGAILCAVLTGRPPYRGANAEATRQLAALADLVDTFATLDACGAEPELMVLCKRCLSPERDDRPRDAGVVAKVVAELRSEAEQRARQAELDRMKVDGERATAKARAEEEAKTRRATEEKLVEQRKRWRSQRALAGVVMALVLSLGAGAWWRDRQETARRGAQTRNEDLMTALLERGEAALRAGDAPTAGVLLEQAEKRTEEDFPEALKERLTQCREDLDLLHEIDRLEDVFWTTTPGPFRFTNSDIRPSVFTRHGMVIGRTPTADVARRVNASLIREHLLALFDRQLVMSSQFAFPSEFTSELKALLHAADPDEFRDTIRTAIAEKAETRVLEMLKLPAAVAQPSRFTVALGEFVSIPPDQRARLLTASLIQQAGNYRVLMGLAHLHSFFPTEASGKQNRVSPPVLEWIVAPPITDGDQTATFNKALNEREKWVRAALAVRSWSAAPFNDLGVILSLKGEWCAAIAYLREGLRLQPESALIHINLASALAQTDDLAGAVSHNKEAIRLNPKSAGAHFNLGQVLLKKNELPKAAAAFRQATQIEPKFYIAWHNLGVVLDRMGEKTAATIAFQEALRIEPRSGDTSSALAVSHTNRGIDLLNKGDVNGAIDAAREAIKADPKYTQAHRILSNALHAKGELDSAIAVLHKAIEIDPQDAASLTDLSNALLEKGQVDRALVVAKDAIKFDPKIAQAHGALGNALFAKDDLNGAIAAFREAIKQDPKYAVAHTNLGAALLAKDDVDGAIAALKEAIKHDPKYAVSHYNLGLALAAKDSDGAVAAFKEAIKHDPKCAPAHYSLGIMLQDKGDPNGAIAAFKEAVKINPKDANAHYNLGLVYRAQKNYPAAIVCAAAAREAEPRDADAHALLGDLLRITGDIAGARTTLTEAVKLDPQRFGPLLAELPLHDVAPPPHEKK